MKAIYFDQTGDPQSVLAIKNLDKPIAQANEVVVKMLGSTINPADFLFITGNYRFKPEFPQIAGLEGAGFIDSAGTNVNLPIGTLVAFLNKNAWAEYVAVPQEDLFILPKDFPIKKAVQFALNPVTAWGLLQYANLKAGDWLLLSAGSSVVAKHIARLAILRKINVIATVRDARQIIPLNDIGIKAININDGDIKEQISQLTNGKGANCVLDAVGGETGTKLLECLGQNGKFIIYGKLGTAPTQFHNVNIQYKNLSISAFGVRGYITSLTKEQREEMIKQLITIIGAPDFDLDVAQVFAIDDFEKAIKTVNANTSAGKVLFKFTDDI